MTLSGHLVNYVQTIFRFGKPSNYNTQYVSTIRRLRLSVPSLPQDTHLKIARDPECFRGKEGG